MQLITSLALAHGGGLDSHGCHHQRSTGGYHCHRSTWHAPATSHPEPKAASHKAPAIHPKVPHGERHGCRYTVGKGDSVSLIAQNYNVTVDQLTRWNHLDHPENIKVGAELHLEEHCADEVTNPPNQAPPPTTSRTSTSDPSSPLCGLTCFGIAILLIWLVVSRLKKS